VTISSPGCTTIAKRALNEFRGARSNVIEVPGTISRRIDDFHAVDIRDVRSDLGTLVPTAFADALPRALQSSLINAETAPFAGEGPSLTVAPSIRWYHQPGGVGGLLGSDAYAVVMFHLSNGDDELGKVQVVTRNASSRIGEREMAESMAQELAEWFNDRRPGVVEDHEDHEEHVDHEEHN